MRQKSLLLLIGFCLVITRAAYTQNIKLWSMDVTNKRVLIDTIHQNKFKATDTARFKFDFFSTYSKAYDTKKKRYILECDTALILFNANGSVNKTIHKTYDLEGLEYNPLDGFLYGVAFKTNSYYFTRIDLNNGKLSLLKSLSDYGLTTSTIDYENGYYYIVSDSKGLFKIDIRNGNKLDSNKLFTTNNCSCNEYDNETEQIATICVINSKKVMQLYNPSNRSFNTIDTIEKYGTGYFGYNAATFNQATGDWYFNLGKNIGVKNSRTNARMDTITTGFNRIRSIEYPGQACYYPIRFQSTMLNSPRCHDGNDGSIEAFTIGGRAPYQFSINNNTWFNSSKFNQLSSGVYQIKVRDKNELCQNATNITLQNLTAFQHSIVSKDNVCNGEQKGSLRILTNGNTAPYRFALNGGIFSTTNEFNNLGNGQYKVYIKDTNECLDSITNLSIYSPSALSLDSITIVPISCYNGHNGALFANPKGGVAPYYLSFNGKLINKTNTIDSISTGKYVFQIKDANACVYEHNFDWLNSEPLALTAFVKNKVCDGDAPSQVVLKINPLFNKVPYTLTNINSGNNYFLNDTIKSLKDGDYTFTIITDKGCTDTFRMAIKTPKGLSIAKTKDTILCEGQFSTIDLNTTGAKTYEIIGDNGSVFSAPVFTTNKAGTYISKTNDSNACQYRDTFQIYKINTQVTHDFLVPSMALLSDTVYAVIISNPTADNNKWTCNNANAKIKTINTNNAQWQFKDTGIYTLHLKSNYGACHFETAKKIHLLSNNDSLKLERTLGYRSAMIQSFKVYANPHDGQHFSIEINLRDTAKAMLYKIDGNGGSILSELDLGYLKNKTFMSFPSIKSEVYYLKLVVGRESRGIKVVAVL
jgi:hypothetical protein